jgi:hypothetical protein
MKTILLSTVAVLLLGGGAAMAQTAVGAGTADSNSTSTSSSSSGASNQGNRQAITFNSTGSTVGSSSDPYSGTSRVIYSGDQTIRTAPTVYAPPVSGGNPCTLAVSGGASFLGWGAAAGGTFVDQDCADRQKIAMIWNAGYKSAAKELMCRDRATYEAFRTAGEPCAIRPEYEPKTVAAPAPVAAPQPMVQTQPMPAAVPQQPVPRCNPRRGINDNCYSG